MHKSSGARESTWARRRMADSWSNWQRWDGSLRSFRARRIKLREGNRRDLVKQRCGAKVLDCTCTLVFVTNLRRKSFGSNLHHDINLNRLGCNVFC